MIERVVITGKVRVLAPPVPAPPATLYVRLRDVSEMDAPARLVSELRLDGFDWQLASIDGVPFSLSVDSIEPRTSYTLSVLIDVDGDGRTGPDDFVSKGSYPVLTYGYPSSAVLMAERARP